mgnify:CR=1 FL=1
MENINIINRIKRLYIKLSINLKKLYNYNKNLITLKKVTYLDNESINIEDMLHNLINLENIPTVEISEKVDHQVNKFTLNEMNKISNQIDNVIRKKLEYMFNNNNKVDISNLNIKYMDFFFNKNAKNIVLITDITGKFVKINNLFSQHTGYTNDEIYRKHINDFVIRWESVEYIDDTKTKCRNVYKHKINNKLITLDWFNVEIEEYYYCIAKIVEDKEDVIVINEKLFLKVDRNMTKVVEMFSSKKELSTLLQVTLYKLNQIINNKELYNDFYYLKYNECPKELIYIHELI